MSVVAAMTTTGIQVPMMLAGSTDASAFEAWVAQALVPLLSSGMVVFMDNVRFHLHPRVRVLIEFAGCVLSYLPAYSPDLNAIEEASLPVRCVLGTRRYLEDQDGVEAFETSGSEGLTVGFGGGLGECVAGGCSWLG